MKYTLSWLAFSLLAATFSWSQCVDIGSFRSQAATWGQGPSILDLVPMTQYLYVDVIVDAGEGGGLEATNYHVLCGSPLTLTANPDNCFRFESWSGDLAATTNPLVIPAVQAPLHLTAHFAEALIDINVSATNGGSTDMDGTHAQICGTFKVWANANTVSEFSHWSGDVSGQVNPLELEGIMENIQIVANFALKPGVELSGSNIAGLVTGLADPTAALVVLEGDEGVRTTNPDQNGNYVFDAVPDGAYFLKIEAEGYDGTAKHLLVAADQPGKTGLNFAMAPLEVDPFTYYWEQDGSTAGARGTSTADEQATVAFLDESLPTPGQDFAEKLFHDYNVILSDQELPWSGEQAYRLLEMMKSIPQVTRNPYSEQTLKPSKWLLTENLLQNDIEITRAAGGDTVRISTLAFANVEPRMVELEGVRGRYFARRLHLALVRFVTEEGTKNSAVQKILNDRYGVTTTVPSYTALTAQTTAEGSAHFQAFEPSEMLEIINMFEEMPLGLQVTAGLRYLVRRLDGETHPQFGSVPVVGWPQHEYIEFMASAFQGDLSAVHRLLIHEKTHFLWENLFSEEIKDEWIAMGGWSPAASGSSSWRATRTTEFVGGYGHPSSPGEDMAECLAIYVMNPSSLRALAEDKYAFLRDRLMHGSRYITQVNPQYTFEVLNLHPDHDFPGKIINVSLRVAGAPTADKQVTVEVKLRTDRLFEGAKHGYMRIFSQAGTYVDLYVYPVNAAKSILRGSFTLSKHAKRGFWRPEQITIIDLNGYQRLEGVHDFGWRMFINNPLEDLVAPTYVPNSLEVTTYTETHSSGHDYTVVDVSWEVDDNLPLVNAQAWAAVRNLVTSQGVGDYGSIDPVTGLAHVRLPITEYFASGTYGIPIIKMRDGAHNYRDQNFSATPPNPPMTTVEITTTNPDSTPPELDLDSIEITATPTNPQSPNGETAVRIVYYARDDKSGVGRVFYRLKDPQGIKYFEYHYHANTYTMYFNGDPTEWRRYEINLLLPTGSAPGIWSLDELSLSDKALNNIDQFFTGTTQFEVNNSEPLTTAEYQRQPPPVVPEAVDDRP